MPAIRNPGDLDRLEVFILGKQKNLVTAGFSLLLQPIEVVADSVRGGDAERLADLARVRRVVAVPERAVDVVEDRPVAGGGGGVRTGVGRGPGPGSGPISGLVGRRRMATPGVPGGPGFFMAKGAILHTCEVVKRGDSV